MKNLTCWNHLQSVLQRAQLSKKWVTHCKASSLACADAAGSSQHINSHLSKMSVQSLVGEIRLTHVSPGSVNVSIGAEQPDSSISLQRSRHFYCAVWLILQWTALGLNKSHQFFSIDDRGSLGWLVQSETPTLGKLHLSALPDPHHNKILSFGEI